MNAFEALEKSHHSACFAHEDLRRAMSAATPTQALLILPMIERQAAMAREIGALLAAMHAEKFL